MQEKEAKTTAAINALRTFAWLNFAGGIIIAIMVWADIGTRPRFAGSSFTELNPIGVALGFILLASGVLGCVFFLVICECASAILETRDGIKSLLKQGENANKNSSLASGE